MAVDARKILANVNPKFYFWVCDGQIIKNLQEMAKALARMNNNVYRYHVNKDKNDFKSWIKDVLNDQTLAREVAKCKSPASLAKVVKTRLDFLKKKRKKQLLEKKVSK
jgi:heme oxygenase